MLRHQFVTSDDKVFQDEIAARSHEVWILEGRVAYFLSDKCSSGYKGPISIDNIIINSGALRDLLNEYIDECKQLQSVKDSRREE